MFSTGRKLAYLNFILLSGLWLGCATEPASESKVDQPLVNPEHKLSADRKAFAEMRKEIPQDKRQQNDEIAFIMQLMAEVKRPPVEIREKFFSAVSKNREKFNKDLNKKREEYVRKERQERETFSKELESARKDFSKQKASSDQRKSFYDSHEQKRKDFYSQQRERRDEFEADVRDQRKNFDDYMREKNSEFTQEHRAYSKRYDDLMREQKQLQEQKLKSATKAMPAQTLDIEKEYEEIDRKKAEPLGAGE